MGRGHENYVTADEQRQFTSVMEVMLERWGMSWGQIFTEARIGRCIKDDTGRSGIQVLQDAYRGKADRDVFNAVLRFHKRITREGQRMAQKRQRKELTETQLATRLVTYLEQHPGTLAGQIPSRISGGTRARIVRDQLVQGGTIVAVGPWPPRKGQRTFLYLPGQQQKNGTRPEKTQDRAAQRQKQPEGQEPLVSARWHIEQAIAALSQAAKEPPTGVTQAVREAHVQEMERAGKDLEVLLEALK